MLRHISPIPDAEAERHLVKNLRKREKCKESNCSRRWIERSDCQFCQSCQNFLILPNPANILLILPKYSKSCQHLITYMCFLKPNKHFFTFCAGKSRRKKRTSAKNCPSFASHYVQTRMLLLYKWVNKR